MRNLLGTTARHRAGGSGELTKRIKKGLRSWRRPFLTVGGLAPPATAASAGSASPLGRATGAGPATWGRRCGWVAAGRGTPVGQRKGDGVRHLFADLGAAFLADDQLEQNASLQLLDGVDYLATRPCRSSPLGVDSAGGWDLDLKVGIADSAFPGY